MKSMAGENDDGVEERDIRGSHKKRQREEIIQENIEERGKMDVWHF